MNESKSIVKMMYPREVEGQTDEKLVLTTQYLLDNVLWAISEARFNMKNKGKIGLRPLID